MFLSQLKIDRPVGTEADLGSARINCFRLVKSSSFTFLLCVLSTVKVLYTSPGYPDTIPSFSDIRRMVSSILCRVEAAARQHKDLLPAPSRRNREIIITIITEVLARVTMFIYLPLYYKEKNIVFFSVNLAGWVDKAILGE